jgi:hypothetical protein
MTKHQSSGMEKLSLQADFFPAICASIVSISADRMSNRRHVGADLVGPARLEPNA